MSNRSITKAVFGGERTIYTHNVWQYDYGQTLKIVGLALPEVYEVHFSNSETGGTAYDMIGNADGVLIPDELLTTGQNIYAFVFLHDAETDGETEYKIKIPVKQRPKVSESEPTPVQQDIITQAIAALNQAVEQTGEDAEATEAARERAEDAADTAVLAANSATESQRAAAASERNAGQSATAAANSAASALESERESKLAEANAETYAERAEQAATTAGYLDVEIDANGHLIYTRTDQVDVDFAIINEHLVMEVI